MIKYYIAAACLLSVAMVGCETSDVDGGTTPKGEIVDVSVKLSVESDGSQEANAGSRVSVVPETAASSTGEWAMSWESTDTVLGICDDTDYYSDKFSISEFVDSNTDQAIFEGTATSGSKMRFIYPYSDSAYADGIYKIDVSSQTVRVYDSTEAATNNAYTHFADNNLYMISDVIDVDTATEATPLMSHLLSAFELVFKLESSDFTKTDDTGYTSNTATGSTESIKINSFTINKLSPKTMDVTISSGGSYSTSASAASSGSIVLTLDEPIAVNVGETIVVPFAVIPHTFSSLTSVEVRAYYDLTHWYSSDFLTSYGASSDTNNSSVTKNILSGVTIEAGTHNVFYCDVSMATNAAVNMYGTVLPNTVTFTLIGDTYTDPGAEAEETIIEMAERLGFTASEDGDGNLVISSDDTAESATLYENIKTLSDAAAEEGLTIDLTLSNITSITTASAFANCTAITSINLPLCTSIDANTVFTGCSSLYELHLGTGTTDTTLVYISYSSLNSISNRNTTGFTLYVPYAGTSPATGYNLYYDAISSQNKINYSSDAYPSWGASVYVKAIVIGVE